VRDLYGSRWAVFRHGILPQTKPGLIVAAIITFIPALGMFVVPDLLGGGRYLLLGNVIQQQFGPSRDFPFGAALSFSLIVATLIAMRLYRNTEGVADERG
jgi:spermidine/putrescine transport system permease protein